MKKITCLFLVPLLFSCGEKKEILLPKSDVTVVKEVLDLSKVDFFFSVVNNDTLAVVNKNTVITTTNWVFNIDKRLPLKTIIPEIKKLQAKKLKRKSDEDLPKDNFYSYADSIGKNLAFIPFTKIVYREEKPKSGLIVFFKKDNQVFVNDSLVKRVELGRYLNNAKDSMDNVRFCFDKNSSFGTYIQNKLFMRTLDLKMIEFTEFVY
ncbi:hypothetical protein FEDK69T_27450 [Flavobacterium enshiense DK69]|uniref:Lipoprotein n=1 Tax=Flavobacterium enshiense DK69 TaxID=1107311 RepID=V6S0P4_9FLAO|nr:hypothetical protein [Flavobacterium enshiense]ESU20233.1 hypothetical protein FEDK69T_27450 [Flavobacterium enshiense DK69]KGO95951.1 hypothetical protein Q767_09750 [Flavobacterium enshiense DK69]